MGCVGPRPGTPPSGSDSRFAGARAPASPGGPGVAVPRCPDPGRPRTAAGSPARRTPPRPSKRSAHRLTCVLAAGTGVPGDPSDPDPPCRGPAEGAAVTEHARRRGEDTCRTDRPARVRWPLSQPRPISGTEQGRSARPRTARHGRRTSECRCEYFILAHIYTRNRMLIHSHRQSGRQATRAGDTDHSVRLGIRQLP